MGGVLKTELTLKLCLSSCAVSVYVLSWLAGASVAAVISRVGICFWMTAKLRPSRFSFSVRILWLKFFTTLSWSSWCIDCCLACRRLNFWICLALVSVLIFSVVLLHHVSSSVHYSVLTSVLISSLKALISLSDPPPPTILQSQLWVSHQSLLATFIRQTHGPFNDMNLFIYLFIIVTSSHLSPS